MLEHKCVHSELGSDGDRRHIKVTLTLRGEAVSFTFDVTGLPIHVRQRKRIEYLKMFRRLIMAKEEI